MSRSLDPLPKLRVTLRDSTPLRPHDWQTALDTVDGDDEERADLAEFCDNFCFLACNRASADNKLDLSRLPVALAFGDFAGEDNVFEIKDRELVIFKCLRCV